MWKPLFDAFRGFLFLARDVGEIRRELEELRKDLDESRIVVTLTYGAE